MTVREAFKTKGKCSDIDHKCGRGSKLKPNLGVLRSQEEMSKLKCFHFIGCLSAKTR